MDVMRDTDGRKLTTDQQEQYRKQAARLLGQGWPAERVAEACGQSRSWAFAVHKTVREQGEAALASTPRPEGQKKLSTERRRELAVLITDFTPRDFGFDEALWNRRIVKDLIVQRWEVVVSLPTVGAILRELGLSPQRPLRRAFEQDPEAVARWENEEFPQIQDRAQQQGAELYFGDEAGVRSDYHSGTSWAPIGQTPVVYTTGNRKSVSMLSAISPDGDISFEVTTDTVDSEVFIGFCRKLMDDVGKTVFLILDRAPYHVSGKTREFAEATGGGLQLFFLPSYSPELNPDELVWKNVKHDHLGRASIKNVTDLRSRAVAALEGLRESPELVTSFFGTPQLAYIGR
jgi:transposase